MRHISFGNSHNASDSALMADSVSVIKYKYCTVYCIVKTEQMQQK